MTFTFYLGIAAGLVLWYHFHMPWWLMVPVMTLFLIAIHTSNKVQAARGRTGR